MGAVMPNGNQRGNTADRRARKLYLLTTFGDGESCACWECGTPLTYATLVADRIVPAVHGGTYCRNNIRPHCATCSHRQGAHVSGEVLVGRHAGAPPYSAMLDVACG